MADGEAPNGASLRARLPRVDAAEAARRNAWLLALTAGGLSVEVGEPSAGRALRFSDIAWIAPERVDGAPAAWLDATGSAALPEALVAFSRLEPLLAALERAIGAALDPQAIETAPADLTLRVRHGADSVRLVLGANARPPRPAEARRAPVGAAARATLACRLMLRGPLAPVAELAALAPGDLVTAPSSPNGIKGWLSAPGVGTVAMRLRPDSARALCEGTMDPTMTPEPPGEAAAGDLPGGLKVRLRLELGAVEVTLADLAALTPGAVLPVEALGESPLVTITAPGATLATGRLVALGEGYGVLVDTVTASAA